MNNLYALLYNFDAEKLKLTKMVCMMMQVKFKEVSSVDYNQPLGYLLGITGVGATDVAYAGEELNEEMLVLHGFDGNNLQQFLTAMQRLGVGRIDLKAMLTENNKTWSAIELFEELCQEREAFKKMEMEKNNQNK